MQKKAAIEISTTTLIGIAIAIPVFVFVILPVMQKALGFIIPKADITTLQNYERLINEINELNEGETTYVPYFIPGEYKAVNNEIDKNCFPNNCLCLCSNVGCEKRVFEKECFKGKSVTLSTITRGSYREKSPTEVEFDYGLGNGVYLLTIQKTKNNIILEEKQNK